VDRDRNRCQSSVKLRMNRGLLAALPTVLIWSWPTIFIKFLSTDFDVVTQNFYRYSAASAFLLAYTAIFQRHPMVAAWKDPRRFLLPSFLVFVFQIVWVQGIYLTTPTIAALISKLDVLFIILLSSLFFASERRIMKSRYFPLGFALAFGGVIGVVLGRGASLPTQFDLGVAFLLLRCLLWAAYIVSVRNLVRVVDPLVAATVVYTLAAMMFLPTVLIFGEVGRITVVSANTNLVLFGSGVLCVGLGNAFNYTAIRYLGSSIPAILLLATPFLTGIFSYITLHETLTMLQVASGLLLILGCWVIIRRGVLE